MSSFSCICLDRACSYILVCFFNAMSSSQIMAGQLASTLVFLPCSTLCTYTCTMQPFVVLKCILYPLGAPRFPESPFLSKIDLVFHTHVLIHIVSCPKGKCFLYMQEGIKWPCIVFIFSLMRRWKAHKISSQIPGTIIHGLANWVFESVLFPWRLEGDVPAVFLSHAQLF